MTTIQYALKEAKTDLILVTNVDHRLYPNSKILYLNVVHPTYKSIGIPDLVGLSLRVKLLVLELGSI